MHQSKQPDLNAPRPYASPEPEPQEEQIRQRAYFLWLDRGCPGGGDWEHWFTARQELLAAIGRQAADAPSPASAHFSIRNTQAAHLSDPSHRFHWTGAAHDNRLDVVAGEARQRVRGRRFGGSLRAQPKKAG